MTEEKMNSRIVQNNVNSPLIAERTRKCPECGSGNIVTDSERAEIYCADCGIVIAEELVDLGPEWRAYDAGQRKKIRAEQTDPHSTGKGLGTSYVRIPGLKKHGKRQIGNVATPNQENISVAVEETNRICAKLELPKTVEQEARDICIMAQRQGLFRGTGGIYRAVSAILLITCRRQEIPILIQDISNASNNEKAIKIFAKSKKIEKKLGLKTFRVSNSDPINFLPKFCSELGIDTQVRNLAKNIIKIAKQQDLIKGKQPNNVAVAAICVAEAKIGQGGEIWEIPEILETFGTTQWTVNKRIGEFLSNESILLYLDKI